MNNEKVTISKGNRKLGAIPSVSLPPCTTCNPEAPCFKKCYAVKVARIYKTAADSYGRNLRVLTDDPARYWEEVQAAAKMTKFFRYHVSGDVPNIEYFARMVTTAEMLPDTQFLAFTKQYKIVNDFMNNGGRIPPNLKIIFSNWGSWKCANPHGFPTCEVIFKGEEPAEDWKVCGGNCTECACRGIGCWELKHGETIAIYEH
jgi:hypothetical protein